MNSFILNLYGWTSAMEIQETYGERGTFAVPYICQIFTYLAFLMRTKEKKCALAGLSSACLGTTIQNLVIQITFLLIMETQQTISKADQLIHILFFFTQFPLSFISFNAIKNWKAGRKDNCVLGSIFFPFNIW